MANNRLRYEEYTTVAEFLLASLRRDRKELYSRFSKYTPAYLARFRELNDKVKELENPGEKTESMKLTTARLYAKANELHKELSFVGAYFKNASLHTTLVTTLKKQLASRNIEGAMYNITALKDLVTKHQKALVAQGMPENTPDKLLEYRDAMNTLNQQQNRILNQRMALTRNNKVQYEALFGYIRDTIHDGKIVYQDRIKVRDYTLTRPIERVRAANTAKTEEEEGPDVPGSVM